MVFFCKGVIETVKKFGWPPDIVHCNGWFTSLVPLYLKKVYTHDPVFENSKIVYSMFKDDYSQHFTERFFDIARINELDPEDIAPYGTAEKVSLNEGALSYSDAVILDSEELSDDETKAFESSELPKLGFFADEEYKKAESILNVTGKVIRGDSSRVASNISRKSIGYIDEPVFGETTNQLFMNTSFLGNMAPDFGDASLDSVVLRFNLDEEAHYGDNDAVHHVEVFQMTNSYTEELEANDGITTFTQFEFDESNLLGETDFVARYQDSILLEVHTMDTAILYSPQLRVRLDNSFGQTFFTDTMNVSADTIFMNIAKGFLLRSTPSTNSMIGLDLLETASRSLDFYYTAAPDKKEVYSFNLASANQLNVIHEYEGSGSDVEAALNDVNDDQELLYVESYSGTNVEFDISSVLDFDDKIINYASLEVTLAQIPEYDYELYPAMDNFYLSRINEDGNLVVIKDIEDIDANFLADIEEGFGGDARTNALTGDVTYTMNVTRHVKEVLSGTYGENYSIILSNAANTFEPNRAIIYGNGEDGIAPKLKLVISEP